MPRGPRLDAPGTLHHVIVRGIEKRRIVDDDRDRERFVERLGGLASETRTAVCAWALMANHAHLLVQSGPGGLAGFMRRLLTGHALHYNLRHRRHGHLFQNRYKSIVCEEDPYFKELVRARLCAGQEEEYVAGGRRGAAVVRTHRKERPCGLSPFRG